MKGKGLVYLTGIMLLGLLLVGCGEENESAEVAGGSVEELLAQANPGVTPEGKTILNIYAQYADDDTMVPYDYALEQVAIAYPNVELNLILQVQDDGATLELLEKTGQLPDIYQANTGVIQKLKDKGCVMELDEVAQKTGYLEKVFPSNKDLVYGDDGHIYCFPYAGNEYVLWYYNKALFEKYGLEVPTTFDELLQCASVFKSNGIVPMALFGAEGWSSAAMYDTIATRYNPLGIKGLDTKEASPSDEGYIKAAEVLEKLTSAGFFEKDVVNVDYDTASAMFLNGEAAMFINGQWYIQDAMNALGDKVDWMYYPSYSKEAYEAGKHNFSGGGSTSGYAVNAKSKNAELAAEVAEFLSEKYCEAKVMYRGNPLVALDTGAVPQEEYPAMMNKLSEEIGNMTGTTKFTWGLSNQEFSDSIGPAVQNILSGESANQFPGNIKQ